VLDDLGLGPSGSPIPPPITFSMVPFPKNREQSNSQLSCSCFTFLVPSGPEDEHNKENNDVVEDVPASAVKVNTRVLNDQCGSDNLFPGSSRIYRKCNVLI